MRKRLSALLLGISVSYGCSAAMPDDTPRGGVDAGVEDPALPTLRVNSPGVSTYWDSVPLTGQGPSNGTLIVESGNGQVTSKELGSDGSFCIDISLIKGTVNTITVRGISAFGDYSLPEVLEIRQEGEPPDNGNGGGTTITYANVGRNASNFLGTVSAIDGSNFYMLSDGNHSAFVTIKNAATSGDKLYFKLSDYANVKEIRFLGTADCYLEKFRVFLSDNIADPGDVYGASWTQVADVSNGTSDYKVTTSGSNMARWLGIDFRSRDCGPAIGPAEHQLYEIEAWAEVSEEDPGEGGTGAPSCASGF
jgi:hypothetical protein